MVQGLESVAENSRACGLHHLGQMGYGEVWVWPLIPVREVEKSCAFSCDWETVPGENQSHFPW